MAELTNAPTLDQVPAEDDPIHLLLIADSKMGKSTYVAQAALDGYRVIYVDADNGIRAVRHHLRNNPEAMRNVLMIPTKKPAGLIHSMLTEGVFRWNITQDKSFSSGTDSKSAKMFEMRPARIPKGVILCVDSWSTTALDAMELGATANKTTLETMDHEQMSVYGDAGMKLTLICAVIQHAPFHVIVLAHGGVYERYDKPLGKQEKLKMKDMILRETTKVPLSSSKPHGVAMAKYFNEIAWLDLDVQGRTLIDFTRERGRIGGGTPNKIGLINELTFKNTFAHGPVETVPLDSSWINFYTVEEWIAENKPAATPTPAPKPAGVSESGVLTAKPAVSGISALMLKKK